MQYIKSIFFYFILCYSINSFCFLIPGGPSIYEKDDSLYVTIDAKSNPIFNINKRSCCLLTCMNSSELWIKVKIYCEGKNPIHLDLPLQLFINKDLTFKKSEEIIEFTFPDKIKRAILIDEQFAHSIQKLYDEFISKEKLK